jgi:tetrahydromethanopterin S-methyltransferase subunit G
VASGLLAAAICNAAVEAHEIHIDFTFDSASIPYKIVSGYRVYMNGSVLCESQDSESQSVSCPVAAEPATYSFTLSTLFDDGSESPQSTPFPFTITASDSDSDGIVDSWEQTYFGNLTTANATTDYDRDGYTDLVEYLNETDSEVDTYGASFDPTVVNAPGGTGYTGNLADSLVINFPGYGLYTYNSTSSLTRINTVQANLVVTADIDSDGTDEIIAFFEGYGLYVWDNGTWGSRINTVRPEAMIKFGNRIAMDFGAAYGLYTYSTAEGFIRINSADPTLMAEADVDADGVVELAVYFPGFGLYVWGNGAWGSRINTVKPETMIKFGNRIAMDFGAAYGLYTYSTAEGFIRINSADPTLLTEADVDADGVVELAVYFPGYGLNFWDGQAWGSYINTAKPEAMVRFGNRFAIDFGAAYGLYTYNTWEGFIRINSADPTLIAEADLDADGDMELATYFTGFGLYLWDNGAWGSRISATSPNLMTTGNIIE